MSTIKLTGAQLCNYSLVFELVSRGGSSATETPYILAQGCLLNHKDNTSLGFTKRLDIYTVLDKLISKLDYALFQKNQVKHLKKLNLTLKSNVKPEDAWITYELGDVYHPVTKEFVCKVMRQLTWSPHCFKITYGVQPIVYE